MEFSKIEPIPPAEPAENCKPELPLITPLIVRSLPLVQPIMVLKLELLIKFPLTTPPTLFPTYPAIPEPLVDFISVVKLIVVLAKAKFILEFSRLEAGLPII